MTVTERVSDGWYGFLGRIRHPGAESVTTGRGAAEDLLRGHKNCLVVTYRRTGEAMPTPVWFGLGEDGRVYFRTEERVGKVKRIRANDRVLVGPCDSRGKPLAPAVEGRARILPPGEEARAESAIQANFGLGRRLYKAVVGSSGSKFVYVEVTPDADPSAGAAS
jgi:PPOX class probable F420-dependent enzyme